MADAGRARKIADRIKVIAAETLERRVKDPDLGFVTITDVRVTGDLQHASVFYTVFGDEAERETDGSALESTKGKLRSASASDRDPADPDAWSSSPTRSPRPRRTSRTLLREAKERDAAWPRRQRRDVRRGARPYKKPAEAPRPTTIDDARCPAGR